MEKGISYEVTRSRRWPCSTRDDTQVKAGRAAFTIIRYVMSMRLAWATQDCLKRKKNKPLVQRNFKWILKKWNEPSVVEASLGYMRLYQKKKIKQLVQRNFKWIKKNEVSPV